MYVFCVSCMSICLNAYVAYIFLLMAWTQIYNNHTFNLSRSAMSVKCQRDRRSEKCLVLKWECLTYTLSGYVKLLNADRQTDRVNVIGASLLLLIYIAPDYVMKYRLGCWNAVKWTLTQVSVLWTSKIFNTKLTQPTSVACSGPRHLGLTDRGVTLNCRNPVPQLFPQHQL